MSADNDDDSTLEGTLAIIKPDALHKEKFIMEKVREEGFLVVERKTMRFTRKLAERFYEQHRNKDYFPELVNYMISGEVVAVCLARKDGIERWKAVMGPPDVRDAMEEAPNSLRAIYGNPEFPQLHNGLHGSASPDSAEQEIEIVFPHILHGTNDNAGNGNRDEVSAASAADSEVEDFVDSQPKDNKEYLRKYVCPTLLRGLSEMYETRPESPIKWLAEWLTDNNPKKGGIPMV